MTTLIIKVDDERTESIKKILSEIPYVRNVVVDTQSALLTEPLSQYERIKKALDEAKGKNLFADIEDPVEWQRELRKEWDRDI
ncbi:hypothetical protein [Mucilaginibacter ginsenosidivorax]|uniref:Uncharacterized protein n=1 Tax=Mucilaginibacter ginsenosidivorax TaxID=862126 RepID=A0A5B8W323_9SPHI|nr:hypothetical protein [Mucilaginibacter ginsenosidivorax]QEC78460.1 hypothetical protein FSB76_21850 [Mucilaginibacter ginsenosidivorax]